MPSPEDVMEAVDRAIAYARRKHPHDDEYESLAVHAVAEARMRFVDGFNVDFADYVMKCVRCALRDELVNTARRKVVESQCEPTVRETVEVNLDCLTRRERRVIELRFWWSMTLEEVGTIIHVTRERVRQIEARALNKLRRHRES